MRPHLEQSEAGEEDMESHSLERLRRCATALTPRFYLPRRLVFLLAPNKFQMRFVFCVE